MKRVQNVFSWSVYSSRVAHAQSSDTEWQAGVAVLKETIQMNPAQAARS